MQDGVSTTDLFALEQRVARDLATTAHPSADWMPRRQGPGGEHLYDVVIVGGGQGGLATAFRLMRERVGNILVIDRANAGKEGVWSTYARMPTLRSPKEFTGPDLGVASLTYQAWHEALFGAASWVKLDRIPTQNWAAYLAWYAKVLAVPIANGHELLAIDADPSGCLALTVRTANGQRTLFSRKLVLATGQDGTGRWWMPEFVEALPQCWRATSADPIDFAAFEGKTVAVLGAGASAADNAATALEAGAAAVHMFVRRPELQRVQPYLWLTFAGFLRHISEMPDDVRWQFMSHILDLRESMPQPTYDRMRRHAGFHLHTAAGWQAAQVVRDTGHERVRITTAKGPFDADFLICGTGIEIDFSRRPELAALADKIATWSDRFAPPAGAENPRLARFPYLGLDGELTEKVAGAAPHLRHIHDFTIGATMSLGPSGCSINAMNIAVPRLAAGVTRALFRDDLAHHWSELESYDKPIFEPW